MENEIQKEKQEAPKIEEIIGKMENIVAEPTLVFCLCPSERTATYDWAGKGFGDASLTWSKKDDLLMEISKLSQKIKDSHKYSLPEQATTEKILLLAKAGFLDDRGLIVHFYKEEAYPVFFAGTKNILVVAPRVED
jgi:uncharacterized protein involved in tolerance to divalent cations